MNNLRRSRWARDIARVLSMLMVLPPLMLSLSVKPAAAQSTVKTIAVMDFDNLTTRQGFALGRKGADAVFLCLDPAKFDFVEREEVQTWINTMGLSLPLDNSALLKLGSKLQEVRGLEQILTGRVLKADVREGKPRQAHVELEVRLLDVASGEFINGARGQGNSSPRYDDVNADVLVDEAIGKAAFAAITRLMATTIRTGTVLFNKGGEVLINLGAQDGIVIGQQLIVLRQKQKVGRIQVESTTNRDANCRILQEVRGIMTEDICQPVYTGVDSGGAGGAKPRKPGSGMKTVFAVAGGLLAIWLVSKMLRSKDAQNVSVYNVRAAATLTGNNQPAVRVSWERPASPAPPDLVGFQVWRSDVPFGSYVQVAQVNQPYETQFYDTTTGTTVTTTQNNQQNQQGTSVTANVAGIQPGVTYYYRVARGFYRPLNANTGNNNNNQNQNQQTGAIVWSDLSEPTPGVTPLNQPRLQTPAMGEAVDTTSIIFRWFSVLGGDVYRIQVSSSPSFAAGSTWDSLDNDSRMILPGGADNQLMSATWNISSRFPMVNQSGGTNVGDLFWRVGVRKAADIITPEGGFIYSAPVRITLQEPPPPAP